MLRIEELKLTDDQLDLLENWLRKHDVRLFANKYTLGKARKEFNEFMEGELMEGSVRAADFSACVHHFCEFFKQGRRRHYRHNNELTHDQWDQVRMVATRLMPEMQGRPLSECVELMRFYIPCSHAVLMGLPNRFHVWNGAKELQCQT